MASSSSKKKHKSKNVLHIPEMKPQIPKTVPTGYYLCERTPQEFVFTEPPKCTKTDKEVDFNNYLFYAVHKNEANNIEYEAVDDDTLQEILLNPDNPWEEKMKDMVMIRPSGKMSVAVLPHIIDLKGKYELHCLFEKLSTGKFQYNGDTKIVPKFLKKIIDPNPEIRFAGPIYTLGDKKLTMKICAYTDTVVVMRVNQPLMEIDLLCTKGYLAPNCSTRYNGVTIAPRSYIEGMPVIDGVALIVWNARHVGRPSFAPNFERFVQIHNPIAIIVTEIRVSRRSFVRFMEEMETSMGWALSESVGLSGGVAILWDKTRADVESESATNEEAEYHMIGTVKTPVQVHAGVGRKDATETTVSLEF